MAKLNKIAHNRLLLQAEEAEIRGLNQLANGILFAIASEDDLENNSDEDYSEENDFESEEDNFESEEDGHEEDESESQYSYEQLQDEIYQHLWELSSRVAKYYNCEKIDAEKINSVVDSFTAQFIEEVEAALEVEEGSVGPFEPKVMGELE